MTTDTEGPLEYCSYLDVKPCMFCGSKNVTIDIHGEYEYPSTYVECFDCEAQGPSSKIEIKIDETREYSTWKFPKLWQVKDMIDDAVKLWNTRGKI